MVSRSLRRIATAFLIASALAAPAEIRLPNVLSDHTVLQRDGPIRLWGWATPGATLSIRFHTQQVTSQADPLGEWTAWLAPETAGGPFTLTVQENPGGATKTVDDVLVGDVWIASGQSNMEMPLAGFIPGAPLKNGAAEIATATNPRLRLLLVDHRSSEFPLDDIVATWTACTPETAAHFSAVAYFFGREIAAKEQVPVGLIDSTWGGTPADSWVSLEGLAADPALLPAFASRARFAAGVAHRDAVIASDTREDERAKAAGKPVPSHPYHPDERSWLPAGLYNGMIAPLTPYSVKGFLWYQGETNSAPDRAPHYAGLFRALIEDWRHQFAQGNLPFLYVQISSFRSPAEDWGTIRDAQRRALALRQTAMAVILDVGDPNNVHPPDKQTVGARLALAARGMVYGERLEYVSPLLRQVTSEQGGLRVWFDHADGLTARGTPLRGFEIAGPDHVFSPAEASVEGSTVLVSSPVLNPTYVRYNWQGVVVSNLYNQAGLPASTFTSEY